MASQHRVLLSLVLFFFIFLVLYLSFVCRIHDATIVQGFRTSLLSSRSALLYSFSIVEHLFELKNFATQYAIIATMQSLQEEANSLCDACISFPFPCNFFWFCFFYFLFLLSFYLFFFFWFCLVNRIFAFEFSTAITHTWLFRVILVFSIAFFRLPRFRCDSMHKRRPHQTLNEKNWTPQAIYVTHEVFVQQFPIIKANYECKVILMFVHDDGISVSSWISYGVDAVISRSNDYSFPFFSLF